MIYYIEGCTCSGKSTLAKELVNYYKGFELAPEHTPNHAKMKNLSLPEKQKIIFFDFLNHFETLRQTGKDYICDFSPWGVIAFNWALCKFFNNSGHDADQIKEDNGFFLEICSNYFNLNKNIKCLAFLDQPSYIIQKRLETRAREGDNLWDSVFIDKLCDKYKKLFAVLYCKNMFYESKSFCCRRETKSC